MAPEDPSTTFAQVHEPTGGSSNGTVKAASSTVSKRRGLRCWSRLVMLAVGIVLVTIAICVGVSLLVPKQYAARASVLYNISREQPTGFLREDRNLSTQVVLLQSRTVLEPVAEARGITVEDLSASLSASVVQDSEVIQIEVGAATREDALALTDAVVKQYLEIARNDTRGDMQNYLDTELRDVMQRLSQVPPGAAERQAERAPLVDREQWLRTQLDQLRLTDLAGPQASLMVAPYAVSAAVSPRPFFAAATGALTGLFIACLTVLLLARRQARY